MTVVVNRAFARNLKIVMSHGIKVESEGSVLKVDGNWRYIKWDNGVKTWHRVEQLQAQARRKVEVKAAEKPSPARKPRPAPKPKSKGPKVLRELLSLEDKHRADMDADVFFGQ